MIDKNEEGVMHQWKYLRGYSDNKDIKDAITNILERGCSSGTADEIVITYIERWWNDMSTEAQSKIARIVIDRLLVKDREDDEDDDREYEELFLRAKKIEAEIIQEEKKAEQYKESAEKHVRAAIRKGTKRN